MSDSSSHAQQLLEVERRLSIARVELARADAAVSAASSRRIGVNVRVKDLEAILTQVQGQLRKALDAEAAQSLPAEASPEQAGLPVATPAEQVEKPAVVNGGDDAALARRKRRE